MPAASDADTKVTSTVCAEPASVLRSGSVTPIEAVSVTRYRWRSSDTVPSASIVAASLRFAVGPANVVVSAYVTDIASLEATSNTSLGS